MIPKASTVKCVRITASNKAATLKWLFAYCRRTFSKELSK